MEPETRGERVSFVFRWIDTEVDRVGSIENGFVRGVEVMGIFDCGLCK